MTKTEIRTSTTQQLIEKLVSNESYITARQGVGCKGIIALSKDIAKELENRGIMDCETFLDNVDIK